jgi:hypothetical protein
MWLPSFLCFIFPAPRRLLVHGLARFLFRGRALFPPFIPDLFDLPAHGRTLSLGGIASGF